jgi:hypothetical protein
VNGRLRRLLTLAALQRAAGSRLRLAPGRYHVRIRITYQLGTGTRPMNLSRIITVCRLRSGKPSFTG